MYEQYTDKQIVEMLKPKLAKLGWRKNIDSIYHFPETCKMIAAIYRSAYIRGQLGRNFIIGEPKQTEHWVPTTEDNVRVGSKVRYLSAEKHEQNPNFYPLQGTIGVVIRVDNDDTCLIQWHGYATTWYSSRFDLEVLLCE